jgi:hypothetical protein
MTAYNANCPPVDCGPCGTLPSGFVRLRYFYGKRLAVADFLDEQRYHAGKMRFHDQRLHGSGVLCGLKVDLFSADPADATILRVHRGAALDGCGREIIVGWDQCIDVDAWLGRKLQAQPDFLNGVKTTIDLCVVLRYRECPSSPEAAPRDACSCDTSGCDFGRVREEFELDLVARPDPMIVPAIFPPRDQLLPALALAPGGAAVVDQIAALATAGCPAPDADGWLEIACFTATLSDPTASDRRHVTAISAITPAETILYETALLQELLLRELAAHMEGGMFADGPQVESVTLDSTTAPTALVLTLTDAVLGTTVPGQAFALRPFDTSGGWKPAVAGITTAVDSTGKKLTIGPLGTITPGTLFRLESMVKPETPMTDKLMRPLRPLRFSFHFQITQDATTSAYAISAPPVA